MKELQQIVRPRGIEVHGQEADRADAIAYLENLEIERELEKRRSSEEYKQTLFKQREAAKKYSKKAAKSKEDALCGSHLDLKWYKSNRKLYIKGTGAYITQRELTRFVKNGGDFSVEVDGECAKTELLYRLCASQIVGENKGDHRAMINFIRSGVPAQSEISHRGE